MTESTSLKRINARIHDLQDQALLAFFSSISALDLPAAERDWERFSTALRVHMEMDQAEVLTRYGALEKQLTGASVAVFVNDHDILGRALDNVDALMRTLRESDPDARRGILVKEFFALGRMRDVHEHHTLRETAILYPYLGQRLAEADVDAVREALLRTEPPLSGSLTLASDEASDAPAALEEFVSDIIIEPFRIKSVEALPTVTRAEREQRIVEAGYNVFLLASKHVTIDLLTDSGTGAMSARQWGAMMRGDESYAGSPSFYRFEAAVRDLTGLPHIIPTHQGRAAERILFSLICKEGDVVPNNAHFDTTYANITAQGSLALNLPCAEAADMDSDAPFKGNMDVDALRATFEEYGADRIPLVMMTVTNNAGGGQPVSLANLKAVAAVCREYETRFYLDACRFAENAYLIKLREPEYAHHSIREIVAEMFGLVDGCTMSAKKDGMVNIGGFLATRDPALAQEEKNLLILTEGFPTYGGLAGRDLEAIAVGLEEVVEEPYLAYRIQSTRYLAERLRERGVPLLWPPGGHAVYIDAARFAPHISATEFPGVSLTVALYQVGGIRGVELGTAMFGKVDPETGEEIVASKELVRLAIPRRTYTQSQIDYVAEVVGAVYHQRENMKPFGITYQAPFLRHFTARFEPLEK